MYSEKRGRKITFPPPQWNLTKAIAIREVTVVLSIKKFQLRFAVAGDRTCGSDTEKSITWSWSDRQTTEPTTVITKRRWQRWRRWQQPCTYQAVTVMHATKDAGQRRSSRTNGYGAVFNYCYLAVVDISPPATRELPATATKKHSRRWPWWRPRCVDGDDHDGTMVNNDRNLRTFDPQKN